jgi:carboxypeptidase family protein
LGACARGDGQGSDRQVGTIRGRVLLAPTCPVEQVSSPCPPRPLSGVRVRALDDDGDVRGSAASDDRGRFEMGVPAGSYTVTASIEQDPARSVIPTRVEVSAGEVTQANVLVDSGIR